MKRVILFCILFYYLPFTEAKNVEFPEIAKELVHMGKADQRARTSGTSSVNTDRLNTERLKEIIDKIGWPTIGKVGKKGSHYAWLIAQHADLDREFQYEVLKLLKPHMESKQIEPRNYAYLYDRLHTPQKFGTQGRCINGVWVARDTGKIEDVESRRKKYGMITFKEYSAEATEFLCK